MISLKLSNQTKYQLLQNSQSKKIFWKFLILLLVLSIAGYFGYQYQNKPIQLDKDTYIEPLVKTNQVYTANNISEFEKQIKKVDWTAIEAKSVYAFNPETGKVYFENNINKELPIASITKLATILTSKNLYEPNSSLTVSQPLPKMDLPVGLKVGDNIFVDDLYKCALIGSHNDCANALAYEYGIDGFLDEMNSLSVDLGMNNTNFSNPTGFVNTDNYSTAHDLGLLASAFVRNSDLVKITDSVSSNISIKREDTFKVKVNNTNVMLKESKNIKGLKTGFTFASGECLVLFYDYGNENKLITIVLDASDRFRESRELYNLIVTAFN